LYDLNVFKLAGSAAMQLAQSGEVETSETKAGAEERDDTEDPTDNDIPKTDAAFELEYQLRDFIAYNLSSIPIEGRRLQLYVDPHGRPDVEYPSAVGRIDILAVDACGAFFVIELKRNRSSDETMGQLLRYMGWVKTYSCQCH
jgi:hypothetical protein